MYFIMFYLLVVHTVVLALKLYPVSKAQQNSQLG